MLSKSNQTSSACALCLEAHLYSPLAASAHSLLAVKDNAEQSRLGRRPAGVMVVQMSLHTADGAFLPRIYHSSPMTRERRAFYLPSVYRTKQLRSSLWNGDTFNNS